MRPEEEPIHYTSVANPEWLDGTHQAIVCSVKFEHMPYEEDFVARRDDPMPHGREIFERCFKGEFGWIMPASSERVSRLYRANAFSNASVVGDIHSNSNDLELQTYINRHNRENRSGSETGTVVACGSILDHILKRLLQQSGITARLTFHGRIERAHQQGIISDDEKDHLNLVREIRNAFGHEHEVSLADEPQKSNCEKLYADVIGDGATPSLRLRYSSACSEIMASLLARINP